MNINEIVNMIKPLSPDIISELKLVEEEFPKNFHLLKEGKVCKKIWILKKGSAKHYRVNKNGKQMNVWFVFENDFFTNIESFPSQSPSKEYIQLTEDSHLYSIDYSSRHKDLISRIFVVIL